MEKKEFELKEEKQDSSLIVAQEKAAQVASQQITDVAVKLFEISSQVTIKAIEVGRNFPGLALVAYLSWLDLLHGGSYRCPVGQLPSAAGDGGVNSSPFFDSNLTVPSGTAFPFIYQNANVPTILPKILSDPTFDAVRHYIDGLDFQALFQLFSSSLSTLVEAGSEVVKAIP